MGTLKRPKRFKELLSSAPEVLLYDCSTSGLYTRLRIEDAKM